MRQIQEIQPHLLWIGTVETIRDLRTACEAGVAAVVDVAGVDSTVTVPTGLPYCRFPLVDQAGNPEWLLRAAVSTTALLLGEQKPTLVACRHGMSRSVAIAAAALSIVRGEKPDRCLEVVERLGSTLVSPGLWREIKSILRESLTEQDRIVWGVSDAFRDPRLANFPALVREFRAGRIPTGWRGEVWENRWLDLPFKAPGYYRLFSSGKAAEPGALLVVLGRAGEVFLSGKHQRDWREVAGIPAG